MRNAITMNDYMEVEHGNDCLQAALTSEWGEKYFSIFDISFRGLGRDVNELFNGWYKKIRYDSFITCISEHRSNEEGRTGRLSMWRAYGGHSGVAIIINSEALFTDGNGLGLFGSPVRYCDPEDYIGIFKGIVLGMEKHIEYIKTLEREKLMAIGCNILYSSILCTKHPGFIEEREWRVIKTPGMHASSITISPTIETISGIPQQVLKLQLKQYPGEKSLDLSIPNLLKNIIIGPCEHPLIVYNAFKQLLEQKGVPDPEKKIIISTIPLRSF